MILQFDTNFNIGIIIIIKIYRYSFSTLVIVYDLWGR